MTRETRKIQKVGGSTFSVSLPKSWARARELDAGSLVTVYAHPDDVLVVQPGEGEADAERTVQVAHDDPHRLEHVVRAAYAAGLDTVSFEAEESLTREQRRAVGGVTETLPGTAVVEEREDRMVVRVLLDGEEVSIQQSVRQLAFVASSMHRAVIGALTGEMSPDAVDRDAEADRLFALVDRHFQRGCSRIVTLDALGASRPALAELRATARELQQVAANARRLGDLAVEHERSHAQADPADADTDRFATDAAFSEDLVDLGERACSIVETATDAVVSDAGADAARSALAAHAEVRGDLAAAEQTVLAGDDARGVWHDRAIEHCRRTAEHGAAIARLALRGSLRRDEFETGAAGADAETPPGNALEDAIPAGAEAGGPLDDAEDAIADVESAASVDAEGAAGADAPDAAPDTDS